MAAPQLRCIRRLITIAAAWLALPAPLATANDPTLAAGDGHTAVIRSNGELWVAGDNAYGQLGNGTSDDQITALRIASDVAGVFAGSNSTFWIKSDRTLWATGRDSNGILGDGGSGNRFVPAQVATNVSAVAVGSNHMAFLKDDGTLWTTGSNSSGQLGTGNYSSRTVPGQIATGVTAVAAGSSHTLFVKNDGTLWACGDNYNGQLGDNSQSTRATPGQVATGVATVAAGGNSSYFIKTDGTLWVTGINYYGQLGDGTTSTRVSPTQIASGVRSLSASGNHALFIKTDDTLWAMGYNSYRQLTDGTTTSRYVPVQVATAIAEVATGGDHTILRKSDQSLWCAGYNYYGDFGLGYTTSSVSLSPMVGLPWISSAPDSKTVNPGPSITLSVTASGPGPLTYQWSKDGQAISGATSTNHSFSPSESLQGNYTVTVTGSAGSVTSAPAFISVNDPPSIDTPPNAIAVMPGQPAVFSVGASGMGPLSYQWRKASSNITGATNATLTIPGVTSTDAGTYTCVVTNPAGSTTTIGAVLTVGPSITAQPQNKVGNAGSSQSFTVTAAGSSPLTYQWRRNQVPISGATSTTYSLTLSKALEGSYDVVVSNTAGSVTSDPATLTVNEPVTFTTQPTGAILQSASSLLLQVAVNGTGPLSYQWKKGGVAIAGATSPTLNIASASMSDDGSYTCSVTNVVGTVTSSTADVRLAPWIVAPPAGGTVNPGTKITLSVQASGSGTLAYSWRKNGAAIGSGATYMIDGASEDDEGSYSVLITSSYGSVQSGPVELVVNDPPKIKTQPQPVTVKPGQMATFSVEMLDSEAVSYQWRHNDSTIEGATQPFYAVHSADETSLGNYDVIVTSATGTVTSAKASLALDLRPTITRDPTSQSVHLGATVNLVVNVAGAEPLTYQWFRNNSPVSNATSSTLVIDNVQPADEGIYKVEVRNAAGVTLSAPARIGLSEWTEIAGTYQALFAAQNADSETNPWPGRLTVTVNSRGSFTGRLEFDGLSQSFSGVLGNDFTFSRVIPRGLAPALQLSLRLSPDVEDARLDAQAGPEAAEPTALISTKRITIHSTKNPTPQAGRYTMVFEGSNTSGDGPRAPGYALVRVSASGAVSLKGKMPDGANLTCGAFMAEGDSFAFWQGLYRPAFASAGSLSGPVTLTAIPSDQAVAGNLWWHKPQQSSGAFSAGFSISLTTRGAFFEPVAGERMLEVPQGSTGLEFASETPDGQPLFSASVAMSAQNRFSASNSHTLTLQLDKRTGKISGKFKEPGTGPRRSFEGVMLPGSEALGFFSTGTAAGSWTVRAQ